MTAYRILRLVKPSRPTTHQMLLPQSCMEVAHITTYSSIHVIEWYLAQARKLVSSSSQQPGNEANYLQVYIVTAVNETAMPDLDMRV